MPPAYETPPIGRSSAKPKIAQPSGHHLIEISRTYGGRSFNGPAHRLAPFFSIGRSTPGSLRRRSGTCPAMTQVTHSAWCPATIATKFFPKCASPSSSLGELVADRPVIGNQKNERASRSPDKRTYCIYVAFIRRPGEHAEEQHGWTAPSPIACHLTGSADTKNNEAADGTTEVESLVTTRTPRWQRADPEIPGTATDAAVSSRRGANALHVSIHSNEHVVTSTTRKGNILQGTFPSANPTGGRPQPCLEWRLPCVLVFLLHDQIQGGGDGAPDAIGHRGRARPPDAV